MKDFGQTFWIGGPPQPFVWNCRARSSPKLRAAQFPVAGSRTTDCAKIRNSGRSHYLKELAVGYPYLIPCSRMGYPIESYGISHSIPCDIASLRMGYPIQSHRVSRKLHLQDIFGQSESAPEPALSADSFPEWHSFLNSYPIFLCYDGLERKSTTF